MRRRRARSGRFRPCSVRTPAARRSKRRRRPIRMPSSASHVLRRSRYHGRSARWRSVTLSAPVETLVEAFGADVGDLRRRRFAPLSTPLRRAARAAGDRLGRARRLRPASAAAFAQTVDVATQGDAVARARRRRALRVSGRRWTRTDDRRRAVERHVQPRGLRRSAWRRSNCRRGCRSSSASTTRRSGTNKPTLQDLEATLDVQIVASLAPGARIVVYEAPNDERGFLDAVRAAIFDADDPPSILSISYGWPETLVDAGCARNSRRSVCGGGASRRERLLRGGRQRRRGRCRRARARRWHRRRASLRWRAARPRSRAISRARGRIPAAVSASVSVCRRGSRALRRSRRATALRPAAACPTSPRNSRRAITSYGRHRVGDGRNERGRAGVGGACRATQQRLGTPIGFVAPLLYAPENAACFATSPGRKRPLRSRGGLESVHRPRHADRHAPSKTRCAEFNAPPNASSQNAWCAALYFPTAFCNALCRRRDEPRACGGAGRSSVRVRRGPRRACSRALAIELCSFLGSLRRRGGWCEGIYRGGALQRLLVA